MKNIFNRLFYFSFIFLLYLFFNSCIGEDIVEDFVEPQLRIENTICQLQIDEIHNYTATYLNSIGLPEEAEIVWSSSDESILSVDSQGTVTALAVGSAIITAAANSISATNEVEGVSEATGDCGEGGANAIKTGTIVTTSSYVLEGSFTLSEIDENSLSLEIGDDYRASADQAKFRF